MFQLMHDNELSIYKLKILIFFICSNYTNVLNPFLLFKEILLTHVSQKNSYLAYYCKINKNNYIQVCTWFVSVFKKIQL